MKMVAISDTHNQQSKIELPEGDILIHAGDFTGAGTEQEFKKVAIWLDQLTDRYRHIITIAGNHDFGLQDYKTDILNMFGEKIVYLDHCPINIEGINFFGSPYTPIFNNWAFMKDEYVLAALFRQIPDNTDILITHGPPNGILDKTVRGINAGSCSLHDRIKELPNLKHHIFGHIHEGFGSEKIDNIEFHNVSLVDVNYSLTNPVTIIEV